MELLLTFLVGLFIIFGALIVLKTKNNDRLVSFSISMAFGVMSALVFLELLPESLELLNEEYRWWIALGITVAAITVGILLLKVLDYFVPDHETTKNTPKAHRENLLHISIVSSIALILHNVIEGIAIYSSATSDISLGIMISLGVGLHNIPLGMVISSTYYKANNSKKKTMLMILLISLSTFFGGVIMQVSASVSGGALGVLLGITLGMLIYIIFLELLPQIKETKYKKETIFGILFGVFILLISLFLE